MSHQYRPSFLLSVFFHGLLIAFLVFHTVKDSKQFVVKQAPDVKKKIVNAISVDQNQVTAEIKRIKQQRLRKEQVVQAKQRELEARADKARNNRIKEEQRLAQLKRDANLLAKKRKKQQAQEAKRLAVLKKQRSQEVKRLANLKKEQEKIKRDKEKQQEDRRKVLEAKKIADEKRRLAKAQELKRKQAKVNGLVNKYKALIVNAIGQNWILPDNVDRQANCKFEIKIAPGGAVISVTLLRSSGNPILDRSAQTAIYKASPLPVPSDPDAFTLFRLVRLTVRPENIVDNS